MAKRFDRFVPLEIDATKMRAFDGFLETEGLLCLVKGCDWVGRHLGNHVGMAHGIRVSDFKKLVGFNIGTGLVGSSTRRKLAMRVKVGVAVDEEIRMLGNIGNRLKAGGPKMASLEAKEHLQKSRAYITEAGPERKCRGCEILFTQSTIFGRALYCSFDCRDRHYAKRLKVAHPKERYQDSRGLIRWRSVDEGLIQPNQVARQIGHC